MTAPTPDSAATPARWTPLTADQRRVLGVLIEKAKTTPAAYPMTVNAIVAGCNQKNNRDPLTALDDTDVTNALTELQTLGVVSELDWLGRVAKYKHLAYEWLGVSKAEIAVMTELLLRGAQALGELRGRAARMEPIADLAALKPIVDGLVARGLMVELTPPSRGQIVSHNLYTAAEGADLRARYGSPGARARFHEDVPAGPPRPAPSPLADAPLAPHATPFHGTGPDRVTLLASEVADLRAELDRLRASVAALEARMATPAADPDRDDDDARRDPR